MSVVCPRCGGQATQLSSQTNLLATQVSRRKQCDPCGHRFTTIEIVRPPKKQGDNKRLAPSTGESTLESTERIQT